MGDVPILQIRKWRLQMVTSHRRLCLQGGAGALLWRLFQEGQSQGLSAEMGGLLCSGPFPVGPHPCGVPCSLPLQCGDRPLFSSFISPGAPSSSPGGIPLWLCYLKCDHFGVIAVPSVSSAPLQTSPQQPRAIWKTDLCHLTHSLQGALRPKSEVPVPCFFTL